MKKRLIIVTAALLVCALAAGATIAWLTASDEATNTFTVGKIAIALTEPSWTNNSKIYPGAEIKKNPTITVSAGSEACYVYAMVDIQLNAAIPGVTAATLDIDSDWISIGTSGTKTVYRYDGVVSLDPSNDKELTPVFSTVTIEDEDVTEANIDDLDGGKIEVKAYAHQADPAGQTVADAAALAHFGV